MKLARTDAGTTKSTVYLGSRNLQDPALITSPTDSVFQGIGSTLTSAGPKDIMRLAQKNFQRLSSDHLNALRAKISRNIHSEK